MGAASAYAEAGRRHWLDLSRKAGFWATETGTHCVPRHEHEFAALRQFADKHGPDRAQVLDRRQILDRIPISGEDVIGRMYLPMNFQVDPRQATPSMAEWLEQSGVHFPLAHRRNVFRRRYDRQLPRTATDEHDLRVEKAAHTVSRLCGSGLWIRGSARRCAKVVRSGRDMPGASDLDGGAADATFLELPAIPACDGNKK
ncbi:FAD-dependent oxidoreductase [Rhodococcus oxybenzonivorans]|uniref:FAD-dependent oxidoreductase n=1 Tax=Rhodococcus oxybenzonivorans TaxID=1990687 RepID=A0AAE5A9R8_9NOCA|nr:MULTISPECIES: FAD-dependent oxidoreductase [Rhodococcus]MDV7245969.1 FAD-dependent oxidoreductase [Rhodococcus oxybenzonivorans]MDV7269122.1 FAD-dependent oxidoreductase [Rhodococcus oxybenzonivorans]MDV7277564.1 FAD-dependent oxidoreductase [Rhodococcus oxybenzonivorans]MDV7336982.1 FAD-dependent oxidoreductase [Rhodococcus oxybenzonivorans]MDV8104992.1 FAD-dependent oxidoreductase [Rhodococcus sp. IEGM 69]